MFQGLASALEEAASWLQSASPVIPITQLSFMAWVMFFISGSLNSRNAFNVSEQ